MYYGNLQFATILQNAEVGINIVPPHSKLLEIKKKIIVRIVYLQSAKFN